jgi:hypothetical protein
MEFQKPSELTLSGNALGLTGSQSGSTLSAGGNCLPRFYYRQHNNLL